MFRLFPSNDTASRVQYNLFFQGGSRYEDKAEIFFFWQKYFLSKKLIFYSFQYRTLEHKMNQSWGLKGWKSPKPDQEVQLLVVQTLVIALFQLTEDTKTTLFIRDSKLHWYQSQCAFISESVTWATRGQGEERARESRECTVVGERGLPNRGPDPWF